MCICSVHEIWFWFILSMIFFAFALWSLCIDRKDQENQRQIARLERENDKLENVIYNLETNILDLEEKLEAERTRLKATINLLSK